MINDNFGEMIAGIFRPVSNATKVQAGFTSTTGLSKSLQIYGNQNAPNLNFTENGLSEAQVGKGVTPPTRQDENIEDPFTNGGVEDNPVTTNVGGYNNALGLVSIATQIQPTAGSGSVTEAVKTQQWRTADGDIVKFLIFRNVSSAHNFVLGESIDITHEVLI